MQFRKICFIVEYENDENSQPMECTSGSPVTCGLTLILRTHLKGSFLSTQVILRAIYDTFSDAYELVEMLRGRGIPTLNIFISKLIHLLHQMGHAFERLRVIRDYRSPRSIRSFNKLFILLMPIILGPYFVHIGNN